jgi:hypothetical protein
MYAPHSFCSRVFCAGRVGNIRDCRNLHLNYCNLHSSLNPLFVHQISSGNQTVCPFGGGVA